MCVFVCDENGSVSGYWVYSFCVICHFNRNAWCAVMLPLGSFSCLVQQTLKHDAQCLLGLSALY